MKEHRDRFDAFRQVFNEGGQLLTEAESVARRHAAVFGLLTFNATLNETFLPTDGLSSIGIAFTDEQMRQLGIFTHILPPPATILPQTPDSLFNPLIGYENFAHNILFFVTERFKNLDTLPYKDPQGGKSADELLDEDPSGLSLAQYMLSNLEDAAVQETMDSMPKRFEAEAAYIAIDGLEEDISKVPFEEFKDSDEYKQSDSFSGLVDELQERFIQEMKGNKKWRRKYSVYEETGLVPNEHGDLVPGKALRIIGARLAHQQYTQAVNLYLKKWSTF